MAETIVQVTEGAGKKLHAFDRVIGANTVLDEVVLLGDSYLASYNIVPLAGLSTATANSHLIQIMAGASLKVRIRRIEIMQTTAVTTAGLVQMVLLRLTTAGTGGTVVTPSPLDPGDAASGMTAMTLPTVKGAEAAFIAYAAPYMIQTIGASSTLANPIVVLDFDRLHTKPLIIAAGAANGVALKILSAAAAGTVEITVWADESNVP